MASLKFIMDVVNNEDVESRHTNKKDLDAGQSQSAVAQLHEASSSTNTPPPPPPHGPRQRHVSSTDQAVHEDINPAPPAPASASARAPPASQSKRRGASTRGSKSVASASVSSSSSSLPTTATRPSAARPRRRSTASNDSMDHPTSGGYGSGASSASMGRGHLHPSNSPMQRPMSQNAPSMPMRLTPITGRVSRAKKGVPVHVCESCKPAKVRDNTAPPRRLGQSPC